MSGDIGDPIYCKEFIEICRYIKQENPEIHLFIITNGSYKKPEWWSELASVLNHRDNINFSIDGYNHASNNIYRVNSDWDSIIAGIQTVKKTNPEIYLTWASIVFAFNQSKLNEMQLIAKDLGMDQFQITKSTKFGSKYGEAYGGSNDPLEPSSEWISSSHRYERSVINISGRWQPIQDYLSHNLVMFNRTKEEFKDKPITPLCVIGNRGIHVNAEGVVFPCSWTSFKYTSLSDGIKTIRWENSFFAKHRDHMNLRNRSFTDIINDPMWSKCTQGWTDASKTWVECSTKCNSNIVDQDYAVGYETN